MLFIMEHQKLMIIVWRAIIHITRKDKWSSDMIMISVYDIFERSSRSNFDYEPEAMISTSENGP